MNNVVESKNIVITGISRGIGRAIAIKFLNEGYTIYGTYNSNKKEAESLLLISKNVKLFKVDFSKREETLNFIECLHGIQLKALVNNAGIFLQEEFSSYSLLIWDETFEVNVNAPLILSTRLKDSLISSGSIINIASTDGFIGSFSSIAYSSSKSALINLTKSLANNLGSQGIRVNAIAPGWIDTGMSTNASYGASALTPLHRNGNTSEIANVVYFLVSKEASFINGSVLVVDGGYTGVDSIMKQEQLQYEKKVSK